MKIKIILSIIQLAFGVIYPFVFNYEYSISFSEYSVTNIVITVLIEMVVLTLIVLNFTKATTIKEEE